MIQIECCDNLELMSKIKSGTVDLIYCDILYGTGRNLMDYKDLYPMREIIEEHYIPRIKEMHRILKDTGSIYLQMDYRINHWVRLIMDDIFGYGNFMNEIIWHYRTYQGQVKDYFPRKHDNILWYKKSERPIFKLTYQDNYQETVDFQRWRNFIVDTNKIKGDNYPTTDTRFDGYLKAWKDKNPDKLPTNKDVIMEVKGYVVDDVWVDIQAIDPKDKDERIGYPTQKPKALIERIIKASSNEGDLVADFYLGSGTTAEVCKDLNRNFIGCDINPRAVELSKKRCGVFS